MRKEAAMKSKLSAALASAALASALVAGCGSANADIISDTLLVQGPMFSFSASLTEADKALGINTITVPLPAGLSFIPNAGVVFTETACSPNCGVGDISDVIFSSPDGSQLSMTSEHF